jgi:hypothetical protein
VTDPGLSGAALVVPFVPERLRPEVRDLGERLGAQFVPMPFITSYWNLVNELWSSEGDLVLLEQDVLPTEALIREMSACPEPWCSGTYGRWWWEPLCARAEGAKPCGEPPGRCGVSEMTEAKLARIAACPLRRGGRTVLRSDSWLACVKFGSIRSQFPDLLARAAAYFPGREWYSLDRAMWRVLYDDELQSPHLHFPTLRHIKSLPGATPSHLVPAETPDPWDQARYERDRAEAHTPASPN